MGYLMKDLALYCYCRTCQVVRNLLSMPEHPGLPPAPPGNLFPLSWEEWARKREVWREANEKYQKSLDKPLESE